MSAATNPKVQALVDDLPSSLEEFKRKQQARALARRAVSLTAKGKTFFDQAGKALARLVKKGAQHGDIFTLRDGRKFQLVDNRQTLAAKGSVYRPARFPQYELEPYREVRISVKVKGARKARKAFKSAAAATADTISKVNAALARGRKGAK